jgi:1-acyl-sn-glycerol-3-phosphate acyltransferase
MKIKEFLNDIKNGTSYSIKDRYEKDQTLTKNEIKFRKLISPLLRFGFKFTTSYQLIIDRKNKYIKYENIGNIYIVNHRQADDIVLAANAINTNAAILFGNKTLVYETTNGLGLDLNGVILLDRDDKDSRKNVMLDMEDKLLKGMNVVVYVEGYWNTHPTILMQEHNIGAYKLAQKLNTSIIPVVLHYDEEGIKKCYARVLDKVSISKEEDVFKVKDETMDVMTKNLYELMEKYSAYKRSSLETVIPLNERWENLIRNLAKACDIPRINYKLDLVNEELIGGMNKFKIFKEDREKMSEIYFEIKDDKRLENSFKVLEKIKKGK